MAKLSAQDVLKLARLARLELSQDEVSEFAKELSRILDYVEQLDQIGVADLEPTNQVTGLVNVSRPDEVRDYGYEPADLLAGVPRLKDHQIEVKRMIE